MNQTRKRTVRMIPAYVETGASTIVYTLYVVIINFFRIGKPAELISAFPFFYMKRAML